MLPIFWRETARSDLRQIVTHIANEDLRAARRMKIRLETVVLPLSEHPNLYRRSERVPGLREIGGLGRSDGCASGHSPLASLFSKTV